MTTDTRVDGYLRQNGSSRLTPAQVRRSNHKMHGRKNHAHEPGQRCPLCRPPGKAPGPAPFRPAPRVRL